MQLDNIFEDLELQFEAALESSRALAPLEKCNFIRVRSASGLFAELVMPVLGLDFVAGMSLGANNFQVLKLAGATGLEFQELTNIGLPTLRFLEVTLSGFLAKLPLPVEIRWRTITATHPGESARGILTGVEGSIALIHELGARTPIGVPLDALFELRVISVENLSDSFQADPD